MCLNLRILILSIVALTSAAFAQSSESANRRAETGSSRETPAAPVDPQAPGTSERYRRSGSSLLRAQQEFRLPATAGGPDARLADASFFAVPPPEPRVIRKHDLVTVIVREQSEFRSQGSTELEKKAELKAAIDEFIRLNVGNLELEPAIGAVKPKIDLSGESKFEGDGAINRRDSFTARVQAEVVDVKPNGNLVLQARTRLKTDDDEALFVLSGVIRAQDVSVDNTVLSTEVFDLELTKTHEGTVREATRRGWLPKLLDALNPF
jgi:flagellar L-ring protein FlgH